MTETERYASHSFDSDPFPLFSFGFGLTYTDFEYYALVVTVPTNLKGFFDEQEQYVSKPGEFQVGVGSSAATLLSAEFVVE